MNQGGKVSRLGAKLNLSAIKMLHLFVWLLHCFVLGDFSVIYLFTLFNLLFLLTSESLSWYFKTLHLIYYIYYYIYIIILLYRFITVIHSESCASTGVTQTAYRRNKVNFKWFLRDRNPECFHVFTFCSCHVENKKLEHYMNWKMFVPLLRALNHTMEIQSLLPHSPWWLVSVKPLPLAAPRQSPPAPPWQKCGAGCSRWLWQHQDGPCAATAAAQSQFSPGGMQCEGASAPPKQDAQ